MAVAASAALTGFALAYFYIWLLVIGIVCVLITVGGLVFEYHTQPDKD